MKNKVVIVLVNIVVLLLFTVPQAYNFIFLFFLFFLVILTSNFSQLRFSKVAWLILFLLILVFNIFNLNLNLAFQRLVIISFLFAFSPNLISINQLKYFTLFSIFSYIVFFQLGVAFNISFCNEFINSFYPYTALDYDPWDYGNLDSAKEFVDLRFGGIYRNPNVMAQNLILLFMFFLIKHISKNSDSTRINLLFVIFLIPVVFSASRVSFFVYTLTFIILSNKKYVFYLLILFISLLTFSSSLLENFRIFNFIDLISGEGSSGYEKLSASTLYFKSNPSILNLLIGNIDGSKSFVFDNDIGEIIFNYGFIGLFIIVVFYIESFFSTNKNYRFFYVFLFYSFGMGIITSFKIVSGIFLIFSLINSKNIKLCGS